MIILNFDEYFPEDAPELVQEVPPPQGLPQLAPCGSCGQDVYEDGAGYVVNSDGKLHTCCYEDELNPEPEAEQGTEGFNEYIEPNESELDESNSYCPECGEDCPQTTEPELPQEYCETYHDPKLYQIPQKSPDTPSIYTDTEQTLIIRMLRGFYEGLESGNIKIEPINLEGLVQAGEGRLALSLLFNPKPTN